MSKVLIDRELLENLIEQHIAEHGYTNHTAHYAQKALTAGSGTPELPVKAYYHESPNEYGGLNKSVGLEVRKTFIDAPLVLESDALMQIACLEGEIAKRDARILELEGIVDKAWNRSHQLEQGAYIPGALDAWKRPVLQSLPYDFSGNPGTPATQYCNGWNDAGGYWKAHADDLRAELSAIKAQGVVMPDNLLSHRVTWRQALVRLIELEDVADPETGRDDKAYWQHELRAFDDMYADLDRLNAAPAQQVGVPDEREAFEKWGETLFYTACFERHENDEYVGRGLQGAWLGWKARAALGCEPARLCVFPDGWRLVPNEPTLDMGWAYVDAANEATPRKRNSFSHSGYRAMLDVAPTAPTAESGLVEALITVAHWHLPETGQFWPSGAPVSYEAQYGSNGARDYMRGVAQAALAAHRAKGVV